MTSSAASTVSEYLASLPADRRKDIAAIRRVILDSLPAGYEEAMGFGMITYSIPLSRYPDTYNGQPLQLAALAAQKSTSSLYLMNVYGDPALRRRFESTWKRSGKKLDMGKSCIGFRSLDDVALDAVADAIGSTSVEQYVAHYESVRAAAKGAKGAKAKAARPKATGSTRSKKA